MDKRRQNNTTGDLQHSLRTQVDPETGMMWDVKEINEFIKDEESIGKSHPNWTITMMLKDFIVVQTGYFCFQWSTQGQWEPRSPNPHKMCKGGLTWALWLQKRWSQTCVMLAISWIRVWKPRDSVLRGQNSAGPPLTKILDPLRLLSLSCAESFKQYTFPSVWMLPWFQQWTEKPRVYIAHPRQPQHRLQETAALWLPCGIWCHFVLRSFYEDGKTCKGMSFPPFCSEAGKIVWGFWPDWVKCITCCRTCCYKSERKRCETVVTDRHFIHNGKAGPFQEQPWLTLSLPGIEQHYLSLVVQATDTGCRDTVG